MNQQDAENPPKVTTKLQQQLIEFLEGDNDTYQIAEFNRILDEYQKAHDHTRLQELLEALPEKKEHFLEARLDNDLDHGLHIGMTDGFNQAIDEMEAAIKKVYGKV